LFAKDNFLTRHVTIPQAQDNRFDLARGRHLR
jgi:hypothetical protein